MTETALKTPSVFFSQIRSQLFKAGMVQSQVDGINAILARDAKAPQDPRFLAYELATAYWETAHTMQAVRETLASSDDEAIRILESSFSRGRMPNVKTPYWRKDGQGRSWLGRGLVQLTHRDNYEKLAAATGHDLVNHPDKAMELPVAVDVMFTGMTKGLFTGAKLADFFTSSRTDFLNARRIINGSDKAKEVADIANIFFAALKAAA